MRRAWLIAVPLLAAASAFAQPSADPADAVRAEFRTAYELARASLSRAGSDSAALQSYPLFPYLAAARLGRALEDSTRAWTDADAAVASFLELHDGEPVTENLRVAWLQSLATRDLWEPYLEHYRAEVADTGLRCRQLIARVELGELEGIAPPVLDEWLTPYQLPGECEPLFQWSRNQGILDDDATAARVQLLLESGDAAPGRDGFLIVTPRYSCASPH
jgi:soluble lytic murein transglycosylase